MTIWRGLPEAVFPALVLAAVGVWLTEALLGGLGLMAVAVASICAALVLFGRLRAQSGREEERRRAAELSADLRRDQTTGLLARRFFMEELGARIRRVRVEGPTIGRGLSLLLIDLDNFKALNDGFGHKAGDEALAALSERLRQIFPHSCLGRIGGDEFAVSVDVEEPDEVLALAEALLASLVEPVILNGQQVRLGCSVGIAVAPRHASFAADLLALADLALYESKRAGRGRATLFDEELLKEERHLRFIERELRAAVLLDHLDMAYQPIIDSSGRCVGAEALLRWSHPSLGSVSPADFIAVAERSTLIDRVGEWVLRRVCRDLPRMPVEYVAFNVSGAQLQRPGFLEMVRSILEETGTDPRRLIAEITENVALSGTRPVIGTLEAMRGMGIRIALDDFGTGHCSFKTLQALPVDVIKLDRSYVSSMLEDRVSRIFAVAVCETARTLGLPVVAEGVETKEEAAAARSVGCSLFQGYRYSRPVPLRDFVARPPCAVEPRSLAS